MIEPPTEEEWKVMRMPNSIPVQQRILQSGISKVERVLNLIKSNGWVKRTPLSERCCNEACHAYSLETRSITQSVNEPLDDETPRLMCCFSDRSGELLYQVRFSRFSRREGTTTLPQIVHSDWFTTHPSYHSFLLAIIQVARCRYYLKDEADAVLLRQQVWGKTKPKEEKREEEEESCAVEFIQKILAMHMTPPSWKLTLATSKEIIEQAQMLYN
jgi:hypothetical protein